MKFSFNLEPVLKYREGLEEEAKRIYYEAKKKVDEVLDHINELYTFIDRTRNEIQLLQSLGGKTIHDIQIREKFILEIHHKIQEERKNVRLLMIDAEEKHHQLLIASKEYKALVKLREKKYREHLRRKKKHAAKELDDLVTMRHRRGF